MDISLKEALALKGVIALYTKDEPASRIVLADFNNLKTDSGTVYSVILINKDGTTEKKALPVSTPVKVVYPRNDRQYLASPLEMFGEDSVSPARETALLALYAEVCSSWRTLTDVRFKLLGLLPTISVVLLVSLLSKDDPTKGLSEVSRIFIACFGFIVTLGLFLYDQRNTELYDDLVSRARRIEEELGIDTGQFRGRKGSQPFKLYKWNGKIGRHQLIFVQHDIATNFVYWTALLGWIVAIVLIAGGAV